MDFSPFLSMYRAALIDQNMAPMHACCRDDVRVHGSITGRDSTIGEISELLDTLRAALRFRDVEVLSMAGSDTIWMAYLALDTTLHASGAKLQLHGSIICQHEELVIHDMVINFDTMSLFRATGVLPDNVIELGLAGMRFVPADDA